ncbi:MULTISPECIES: hypothetical protein [Bacillaceae]|uniref:Uncharacterized protein n=1 Tax=Domibacillus aminovorans TaxID=29332 RepID=A0A177KXP6_9BACI|nr:MULTISPECIES: hypothetical protein [Bacillaceae]OAH57906.1 hypothetical protein AWH48_02550 [Domibacillus aminovorans]
MKSVLNAFFYEHTFALFLFAKEIEKRCRVKCRFLLVFVRFVMAAVLQTGSSDGGSSTGGSVGVGTSGVSTDSSFGTSIIDTSFFRSSFFGFVAMLMVEGSLAPRV